MWLTPVQRLENQCLRGVLPVPQATVGLLVAKTLSNATANPFLSGGAGSYNPVVALDVFLVQVPTVSLASWKLLLVVLI